MLASAVRFLAPFKIIESLLVGSVRSLHLGSILQAEPPKKKKRVDPQQEQLRIRRKTKRIEREIKRLSRQGRKLKPVEEIEGDRQLYREEVLLNVKMPNLSFCSAVELGEEGRATLPHLMR
ncbi:hypothetical protein SprV_0702377200 [Sparganum proliferum]